MLRLVLAVAFGLLPALCCCPSAVAGQAEQTVDAPADDHACCGSSDDQRAAQPAPADHDHECGCDAKVKAIPSHAKALDLHSPAELPPAWLVLAPLPTPLAGGLSDSEFGERRPLPFEADALPAAPTLRALSVLLLT